MKLFLRIASTLAGPALYIALAYSNFACADSAKTIGFSGPLSGTEAVWGEDVRDTLIFANEKLAGGTYKFVFEDDHCDPKSALTAARKLTTIDKVKVVYIVCGQEALVTASTYKRAQTTIVAPLATPAKISELGIFRTSLSDAFAAKLLVSYVVKHHRSISVLTEANEYSESLLEDFKRSAAELKVYVTNDSYDSDQQDFRALVLRLKGAGVKALFLNTQSEQMLATILRHMREADFHPALYGAYMPGSAAFLAKGSADAEGIVFVDFPTAEELMTEEGRALLREYSSRFGEPESWSYAFPSTFESFRAIHMALESGQNVDQFLKNNMFEGILGRFTFDDHGDVVGPRHVMRQIRNGKSVPISDSSLSH